MAVLAAVALVFALVGCGGAESGPTGPGPLTATYTGYAGPNLCTLVITENTARYAAQVGDGYVLNVNLYDSKGTVSNIDGEELTLEPSNSETTFTVVVSGTYLAELNGTITWENGETQTGPGPLSEVNPAPTITTATLPNGTVGTPYNQTLAVTSITTPNWTIDSGNLPAGLTLSTNGVISGTPTTAGTFNFTVKVTNAVYFDTKQLSIVITSSGGGQYGTVIAEKYRGTNYFGNYDYDDGPGILGQGYFTLNENEIIYREEIGGGLGEPQKIFGNVSTGPDNSALIGTWAYLFQGTTKIGVVWIPAGSDREFSTGSGAVDWYNGLGTILAGFGIPANVSDIPSGTHSIYAFDY